MRFVKTLRKSKKRKVVAQDRSDEALRLRIEQLQAFVGTWIAPYLDRKSSYIHDSLAFYAGQIAMLRELLGDVDGKDYTGSAEILEGPADSTVRHDPNVRSVSEN